MLGLLILLLSSRAVFKFFSPNDFALSTAYVASMSNFLSEFFDAKYALAATAAPTPTADPTPIAIFFLESEDTFLLRLSFPVSVYDPSGF